jgi:hypothetical protein
MMLLVLNQPDRGEGKPESKDRVATLVWRKLKAKTRADEQVCFIGVMTIEQAD